MSEATGLEAKTIHRLLEVDPRNGGFRRDAHNPLHCGLLVIDETSMVDVMLMRALLAAVPDEAALLIVGDVDQLPSVGPGQVLADIIASGVVPVVRLTEVFRQAAQSRIVTTAHGINRGAIPDLSRPEGESDFYFVPAEDPETAAVRIVELVKTRIPKRFGFDAMQDIQVLCPMNRGGAGARSLNIELQAALNPAGERKVERFGWTFAPGDKVMQIENDYDKEVYNGDIGLVADVDPDAGELTARFEGRDLLYGFGELDTLVPAYAATVHKSQGSEYRAVVIPVLTQHYAMLKRNLLYTGVTRGKRLVVLVGQKKAVAIAVRNASSRRRWSKLDEWLAGAEAVGDTETPKARDLRRIAVDWRDAVRITAWPSAGQSRTSTDCATDGHDMETRRLLYDDGASAHSRPALTKIQSGRRLGGWAPARLETRSHMRQEDRGSGSEPVNDFETPTVSIY